MGLTSRRKRPLDRTIPHQRDARLVVIATEGTSTERDYFAIFGRMSSRVQVRVLETEGGYSAPRHVLERLRRFRREFDLGPSDALCLVIDKDRWPDAQLNEVAKGALQMRALLAVSNPCFEVWLYLHSADPPDEMAAMTSQQVKSAHRSALTARAGDATPETYYLQRVDDAVRRAVGLDVTPEQRWPNRLGTRVYRVIEAIRERR